MRRFVFSVVARALAAIAFTFGLSAMPGIAQSAAAAETTTAGARYQVLAWNDLGMHCYNGSFADMMVLPPTTRCGRRWSGSTIHPAS